MSLFEKLFLDLVNPSLVLVPSVLILEALVIIVEAVIVFFLMERRAAKAFAASFSANLLTGMLSIVYFFFPLEFGFAYSRIGEDAFTLHESTNYFHKSPCKSGHLTHFS